MEPDLCRDILDALETVEKSLSSAVPRVTPASAAQVASVDVVVTVVWPSSTSSSSSSSKLASNSGGVDDDIPVPEPTLPMLSPFSWRLYGTMGHPFDMALVRNPCVTRPAPAEQSALTGAAELTAPAASHAVGSSLAQSAVTAAAAATSNGPAHPRQTARLNAYLAVQLPAGCQGYHQHLCSELTRASEVTAIVSDAICLRQAVQLPLTPEELSSFGTADQPHQHEDASDVGAVACARAVIDSMVISLPQHSSTAGSVDPLNAASTRVELQEYPSRCVFAFHQLYAACLYHRIRSQAVRFMLEYSADGETLPEQVDDNAQVSGACWTVL